MTALGSVLKLLKQSMLMIVKTPQLLVVALIELLVIGATLILLGLALFNEAVTDPTFAYDLVHPGAFSIVLAVWYFIATFLTGIFSTIISEAVVQLHKGAELDFKKGLKKVWKLKWTILYLTTVDATIGWILRIGEKKSSYLRKVSVKLAGVAWSAVRILTIPVAVNEGGKGKEVLFKAGKLTKKQWGVNVIGGALIPYAAFIGVGLVGIPAIAILVNSTENMWPGLIGAAALIAAGAVVKTLLGAIMSTKLYLYATDKNATMKPAKRSPVPKTVPPAQKPVSKGPSKIKGGIRWK